MGTPEKRRAVWAMLDRWARDEARLAKLFGEYDESNYSDAAEMQRNLSTAIAYARGYLSITSGEPPRLARGSGG